MRTALSTAIGIAGGLLTLSSAARAQLDSVDAQINAWTDCTVTRTLALADRRGPDEEVSALVMQSCTQHRRKLEAALKAKHPLMAESEVQALLEAVRSSQQRSIPIILLEAGAAHAQR